MHFSIEEIFKLSKHLSELEEFSGLTNRKLPFLAVCLLVDKTYCGEDENIDLNDLIQISLSNPYGGVIGIENSKLDKFLKYSKVLRLHACIHDSTGLMRRVYDIGPGYCYGLPWNLPNCCFLGHLTGIVYLLCYKFSNYQTFRSLNV